MISTNGAQFKHPTSVHRAHPEVGQTGAARVQLPQRVQRPWLDRASQQKYGYVALVRKDSELSIPVTL